MYQDWTSTEAEAARQCRAATAQAISDPGQSGLVAMAERLATLIAEADDIVLPCTADAPQVIALDLRLIAARDLAQDLLARMRDATTD